MMPASHLAVVVAAATIGNTVLAVAPYQGRFTDGLSFVSPVVSCTTTTTNARRARAATAGLSSIASGPPISADSRRPAVPGQGFTGSSARWVARRREGTLRGEASGADGASGAAAGAGAGEGAAAEGGGDVEEQEERKRALAELDRR